jgi:nucleotidyltransferase substrate binding protein (TIGR01987 family)
MKLDLSSLSKAIESLEKTLKVAENKELAAGLDDDAKDAIRAGGIQNFEFTYELCWKFMRRWLGINVGSTYVDGVTRRELFRLSAENRLISDVDQWMEYHDARNETAHTYNEDTADDVFETSRIFLADAKKLLEALKERNA